MKFLMQQQNHLFFTVLAHLVHGFIACALDANVTHGICQRPAHEELHG